jgi:riboflavin synthase
MFSGIIQELGEVVACTRRSQLMQVQVRSKKVAAASNIGDSVAVNGVCFTVTGVYQDGFSFDIVPETVRVSNVGQLRVKDKVNLEPALRVGDSVSGHFVSGHIDTTGRIRARRTMGNWGYLDIVIPIAFRRYVVPKGSIAIDGISLTIAQIQANLLRVNIIPHTLTVTTLGFKSTSSLVNIEFDMLAKRSSM